MDKLIFILFACFCNGIFAQDSIINLKEIKVLSTNSKDFEVDNLGNIYTISNEGQIKKYNQKFDSIGLFNNVRQMGKIHSLHANNPLKLLVFYKDFASILVLDRFMNILSTINLRKQNILLASTMTLAYDNNIWVFDELENKIKKIDDAGNIIFESTDLRQVFQDFKAPQKIIDNGGKLYLYNVTQGVLVFDYYGAFKNKYSILNLENIDINNNILNGYQNNYLQQFNLSMLKEQKMKLVFELKHIKKIKQIKNQFYVLANDTLIVYEKL